MSIPGLSTLKTWGLIALGFAFTIAFALFKNEAAGRAKDKLKGEVQARKTAKVVSKAMMEGINNEKVEIDKARNPTDSSRTGFE